MNTVRNFVLSQPETEARLLRLGNLKRAGVIVNLKVEFRNRAIMELERLSGTIRLVPHEKQPYNPNLEVFFPAGYVTAGDGCTSLLCHDWQDVYDRLKHESLIADPEEQVEQPEEAGALTECDFNNDAVIEEVMS